MTYKTAAARLEAAKYGEVAVGPKSKTKQTAERKESAKLMKQVESALKDAGLSKYRLAFIPRGVGLEIIDLEGLPAKKASALFSKLEGLGLTLSYGVNLTAE